MQKTWAGMLVKEDISKLILAAATILVKPICGRFMRTGIKKAQCSRRSKLFKIKGGQAVFVFTLSELWWLHDHLPREDGITKEIYRTIMQLEKEEQDAKTN